MMEGTSAAQHGLKMNGYIERLGALGFVMDHELSVDLILQSLPDSYAQFVLNYQMNNLSSTIPELINMLKTAEDSIKKNHKAVMLVHSSKPSKKKGKNKKSKQPVKAQGGVKKRAKPVAEKETNSERTCFHCGKSGHWKRNCKVYLESLKKEKHGDASTSGIYVIEVNTNTAFNNQNWVLDTGCGSHICCDMQGLKSSRTR